VQRAPAETEEERIRRFMEALGVPTSSSPAPRAAREVIQSAPAREPKTAPRIPPIDPFPRPTIGRIPPPVAEILAPPSPVPVAAQTQPAPPPLPTRETTVFATPVRPRASTSLAEFEVWSIDEGREESAMEAAGEAGREQRGKVAGTSLRARLATSEGLRDAMILREIFGPPRSMLPLDRQMVG